MFVWMMVRLGGGGAFILITIFTYTSG
jgi:hypothetical protein